MLGFEAALPFLYADFGPRERAALARAIDAWTAPKGLYSTAPDCPAFSTENGFRGYRVPVLLERAGLELRHLVGAARARRRRLAHRTRPLRGRFARAWIADGPRRTSRSGCPLVVEHFHPETGRPYRVIPDYFHSAWLDTFFRHVAMEPLVDTGPLLLEGVPYKEDGDQHGAWRAWRAWMRLRKPKK